MKIVGETKPEITYPDSDRQPIPDKTIQYQWITVIYHNLPWLFAHESQIFVAGDWLWYPVPVNHKIPQAPDLMVAFGVNKTDRD